MGRHIQLISASASEYGHAGNLRRHHPVPVARNPLGVICAPLYGHVAKPLRLCPALVPAKQEAFCEHPDFGPARLEQLRRQEEAHRRDVESHKNLRDMAHEAKFQGQKRKKRIERKEVPGAEKITGDALPAARLSGSRVSNTVGAQESNNVLALNFFFTPPVTRLCVQPCPSSVQGLERRALLFICARRAGLHESHRYLLVYECMRKRCFRLAVGCRKRGGRQVKTEADEDFAVSCAPCCAPRGGGGSAHRPRGLTHQPPPIQSPAIPMPAHHHLAFADS